MRRLLSLAVALLLLFSLGTEQAAAYAGPAADMSRSDEPSAEKAMTVIKYVSLEGSDENTGNTPETALATVSLAIKSEADVIYIDTGTYSEEVYNSSNRDLIIIGYGAVFVYDASIKPRRGSAYWDFRNGHAVVYGITIRVEGKTDQKTSGFMLRCGKGEFTDCTVIGAPYMGFRLDGSDVKMTRCTAANCGVDGFNAHNVSEASGKSVSTGTFIDCVSYGNGDDGLSYHESSSLVIVGGEYYGNCQTGIAPHADCNCYIIRAYIHDNGSGIEAFNKIRDQFKPFTEKYPTLRCTECRICDNTSSLLYRGYGLSAMFYNVILIDCRITGNRHGNINRSMNSTVKIYKKKKS